MSVVCEGAHAQFQYIAILIIALLTNGRVIAGLSDFWWYRMAEGQEHNTRDIIGAIAGRGIHSGCPVLSTEVREEQRGEKEERQR